jgi:RHS repeat-associated protein
MGSMLLAEVQYKANGTRIRTLKFCYDEKGTPVGFVHIDASGTDSFYYYAKNLQGDVVALYRWNWSDEGKHTVTLEATYSYDPWGKLLSVKNASGSPISATLTTNIANVNPFRYRGYYYDSETGFYYLQSRYYDPVISRFINADEYASTGQDFLGCNMFAYCNNNPIFYFDPTGTRLVGVGVQFEVDVDNVCVGVEAVYYGDPTVCDGKGPQIALYTYSGVSLDFLSPDDMARLTAEMSILYEGINADSDQAAIAALKAFVYQDASASASVFAIFGNENFTSADSYSGPFDSVSATANHWKVTYSTSETCTVIGVGKSSKFFDLSYTHSNYSRPIMMTK